MRLIEACVQLSENYIDLQRYGMDEFTQEMELKFRRDMSQDYIDRLMRDYIKRFWRIADRGMLPKNMPNIEAWVDKIRLNPEFMKQWIHFVDQHS